MLRMGAFLWSGAACVAFMARCASLTVAGCASPPAQAAGVRPKAGNGALPQDGRARFGLPRTLASRVHRLSRSAGWLSRSANYVLSNRGRLHTICLFLSSRCKQIYVNKNIKYVICASTPTLCLKIPSLLMLLLTSPLHYVLRNITNALTLK